MRSLYTLLCVAKSLATLGFMHILMYKNICTLIRRAGRAVRKSMLCRQKFAQGFSFRINILLSRVI